MENIAQTVSPDCRVAPAVEDKRPSPRADVGVLLVHGIGDHKEGETLTTFGEQLLDWLRDWLRKSGEDKRRGTVNIQSARLKASRTEAESPAYALSQIGVVSDATGKTGSETWLFAEAWWGEAIQPPATLKLMGWIWTRAPLLIYWHFFLGIPDGNLPKPTQIGMAKAAIAFFLAAFSQLVVALAMILWIVPIGPWRRAIASGMRVLTLTLGDSYVLLEYDTQRAALVERVRRSIGWLTERVDRVVVLAHSQGGAIAHEALQTVITSRVHSFVSVGSGLEKLQFLRRVRETRSGILPTTVLAPVVVIGLAMVLMHGYVKGRSLLGVGIAILVGASLVAVNIVIILGRYKKDLAQQSSALTGSVHRSILWTDIHATRDVVPMGSGSLLNNQTFVKRLATCNENSFLHDHIGYFRNPNDCLPKIWVALASLSHLAIFRGPDYARLDHFARLHAWHCRVLAISHISVWVAGFVGLVVLNHALVGFGESVLYAAAGTPFADVFKPLQSLAGGVGWIIHRFTAPSAVSDAFLAGALFGAGILLIGLMIWWIAFKSFWRLRCGARWHLAARDGDVLHTRGARVRAQIGCASLLGLGTLPLPVLLVAAWAPETFSIALISDVLAITIAIFCGFAGVVFIVMGPAAIRGLWQQPGFERLLAPFSSILSIGGQFYVAEWLLPVSLGPQLQSLLTALVLVSVVITWQCYILLFMRTTVRKPWLMTILFFPTAFTSLVWLLWPSRIDLTTGACTYAASGAAILLAIGVVVNRRLLAQMASETIASHLARWR